MAQLSVQSPRDLRRSQPRTVNLPALTGTSATKLLNDRVISALRHTDALSSQPLAAIPRQQTKPLEEQLYDARAACKGKTAVVAMHLEEEHRAKLFSQVDALLDFQEWDERDKPVTVESFTTFLRLLLFIAPEVRPGLGASVEGEIIAAWTQGQNTLTIECKPADQIRWVVVLNADGERESAAGITHVERVQDVIQAYHPQQWFKHEEKSESARK